MCWGLGELGGDRGGLCLEVEKLGRVEVELRLGKEGRGKAVIAFAELKDRTIQKLQKKLTLAISGQMRKKSQDEGRAGLFGLWNRAAACGGECKLSSTCRVLQETEGNVVKVELGQVRKSLASGSSCSLIGSCGHSIGGIGRRSRGSMGGGFVGLDLCLALIAKEALAAKNCGALTRRPAVRIGSRPAGLC